MEEADYEPLPLTDAALERVTHTSDLHCVTRMTLQVDTRERSLGRIGDKLPKLTQLKLNGSMILSVRDIGTSLQRLHVLWLNQCGLKSLDGIGSFPFLRELYVAFNDITELSPLAHVESLELLDLEANNISNVDEVYCLQPLDDLTELTLSGNPIANRGGYKKQVCSILSRLEMLDDSPVVTATSLHSSLGQERTIDDSVKTDNALVNESIRCSKQPLPLDSLPQPLNKVTPRSRGMKVQSVQNTPRDGTDDNEAAALGIGTVTYDATLFCGKPTKSLRARKAEKQLTSPRM